MLSYFSFLFINWIPACVFFLMSFRPFFHVHAAFLFSFPFFSLVSVLSCPVFPLVCPVPLGRGLGRILLLLGRWRAVWACRTPWHFGSGTMRPLHLSNHLKNLPLHPAWYVEELPVLWIPTSLPPQVLCETQMFFSFKPKFLTWHFLTWKRAQLKIWGLYIITV